MTKTVNLLLKWILTKFRKQVITLPVAEKKFYANPTKALTAIDKKFDSTTENATTWMIDASGYNLTLQDESICLIVNKITFLPPQ